ncbi:MAG: hypothetical protein HY560_10625 [Gemmatimonadetes bacterium]|nr:hypothetical protein [Gemmatimonadota bacterium]
MTTRPPRVLKFISATLEETGGRCCARVELQGQAGDAYAGAAEGACQEIERLRSVAQATADAVLRAVGEGEDALNVEGVVINDTFGQRTVFVQVSAYYWRERRKLLGFSLIDPDPHRAAALAVLNATNRFLGTG